MKFSISQISVIQMYPHFLGRLRYSGARCKISIRSFLYLLAMPTEGGGRQI